MTELGESGAPPGGFDLGGVLRRSVAVMTAQFRLFFTIALVLGALSAGAQLLLVEAFIDLDVAMDRLPLTTIFVGIGAAALDLIAYGAMLTLIGYGVTAASYGRSAGLGETLAEGSGRVVHAIFVLFLQTLAIIAGLILFIVPGLIAAVHFFVAAPAAVVEELGPVRGLSRSSALSDGARWPLFGLLVIMGVVAIAVGGAIGALDQAVYGEGTVGAGGWTPLDLVLLAVSAALNAFFIVVTFVAYQRLVAMKEGVDPGQVANVFE